MKRNADKHATHSLLVFHLVFSSVSKWCQEKKFNLCIWNLSQYSSCIYAILSLKIQMLKPPSEIINLMSHSKSVPDHRHFRALVSSLLLFFIPQHFKYYHCSGNEKEGGGNSLSSKLQLSSLCPMNSELRKYLSHKILSCTISLNGNCAPKVVKLCQQQS